MRVRWQAHRDGEAATRLSRHRHRRPLGEVARDFRGTATELGRDAQGDDDRALPIEVSTVGCQLVVVVVVEQLSSASARTTCRLTARLTRSG
jgi:hypothetical protein